MRVVVVCYLTCVQNIGPLSAAEMESLAELNVSMCARIHTHTRIPATCMTNVSACVRTATGA